VKVTTYRRLTAIRWGGAAIALAAIVVGWLQVVPSGLTFLIFILFGFPAAIATLALRGVQREELS
jgi:hypothetical protein